MNKYLQDPWSAYIRIASILLIIFFALCGYSFAITVRPQVSTCEAITLGLKSNGKVVKVGQLNQDCTECSWFDIMQVSVSTGFSVGLKRNGRVISTSNYDVSNWMDIVQVSTKLNHIVGLKSNGTVIAVGDNGFNKCNVGTWQDITQVSAGYLHTVGLKSDRTVVAVGHTLYGQCNVGNWTNIVQIDAAQWNTVGLRSDGTVVAVGQNTYGQLNVNGWTDIIQIAAGRKHTVGLKSNGTVVATGDNSQGQCNTSNWNNIVQLSAGQSNTVALKSDGTVIEAGDGPGLGGEITAWNLNRVTQVDHFLISNSDGSNISSPQETKVPFMVKISAVDKLGVAVEDFNEKVYLSSNAGAVDPKYVILNSGQKIFNLTIFEPGENIEIYAYGSGKIGKSNLITTVNHETNFGHLSGFTKYQGDIAAPYSNVFLYTNSPNDGGAVYESTTSDGYGMFNFNSIPCGKYFVQAYDGESYSKLIETFVACGFWPTFEDLQICECNWDGRTPILLVPGILGSTIKHSTPLIFPILPDKSPQWDSDELRLHDPYRAVGWNNLKNELESLGYKENCTIFDVAYDWRLGLEDAKELYLRKWVAHAKEKAGTDKVNIIAHSMGGILARIYIQSNNYEHDINRLAMAGVPNRGSLKAYYVWEGGDTVSVDEIGPQPHDMLYTLTIRNMYDYKNSKSLCRDGITQCNKMETYHFIRENVPSIKQLMPTYDDAIYRFNEHARISVEENVLLKALNNETCNSNPNGECLNPEGNSYEFNPAENLIVNDNSSFPEKVMTKIFAGINQQTIDQQLVGYPPVGDIFYQDGIPIGTPDNSLDGDGTVLLSESAQLNWLSQSANINAQHSLLINKIKSNAEFLDFITEGRHALAGQKIAKLENVTNINTTLFIAVIGRVKLYITDGQGNGLGINYLNKNREQNILGGIYSGGTEMSSIEIINPLNGIYNIYLTGLHEESYSLRIQYQDNEKAANYSYNGFNRMNTTNIGIAVDSTTTDKISITNVLNRPNGLKAAPFENSGTKTKLVWNPSSDTDVAGYNVYSKLQSAPYLAHIGSTTENSYNTDYIWSDSLSTDTRIFAISAFRIDGSESFLSELITNDDRDYDGLSDKDEYRFGTNPGVMDSDGDQINDLEEVNYGTNPLSVDTDSDTYNDFIEIQEGSDPLNERSVPPCNCDLATMDGDVDGSDLAVYISNQTGINIMNFAEEFGRTDCLKN
jgi:alpha-tubulin suppressor-like RCC1 family protein